MKHLLHIIICLSILVVLTIIYSYLDTPIVGRSSTPYLAPSNMDAIEDPMPQNYTVPVPTGATESTTTYHPSSNDWLCLGESFDDSEWLAEGALRYTVTNAKLMACLSDVSMVEDFIYEDFLLYVGGEGWTEQEIPVYINDDLSIKNGNYLIFVDVTIENIGARCYTRSDLDSAGYPMGKYEDPYIFRADMLLLINTDILDPFSDDAYRYISQCYFSQMNDYPEYPDSHATYRLEPGETISFTIGYHLDQKLAQQARCPVDMAKFCVTTIPEQRGARINLNLEGTIQ